MDDASFTATIAGCTTFLSWPKALRDASRLYIPRTPRGLGLKMAGSARIAHDGRTIEAEVEITDEMMPGVVSLPHGWGHDQPGSQLEVAAANPGANLNALMDENRRDPLSGNAVLSGMEIEMTPVAARVLAGQAR